jgi:hypothetical protein
MSVSKSVAILRSIERDLKTLAKQKIGLLKCLDEARANLTIQCNCGGYHKIRDLKAIQHHYYTAPHGHTGGDYWSDSNMSFLCPKDESYYQRLLFDNYDVDCKLRGHFDHNPEMQFKRFYRHLFKEQMKESEKMSFVNSYYVDKNRKKFGLVEKEEKK